MSIMYGILKVLPFLDKRAEFIVGTPEGGKLLDIGCGHGYVLARFAEMRPDIEIHAVDIDDFSAYLPPAIKFQKLNAETGKLPFADNQFDRVSIIHVVEHMSEVKGLLSEIMRVLKPGGKVYIETPDSKTSGIFKLNASFKSKEGGPLNFFDDPTHKKLWTRENMNDLFSELKSGEVRCGEYRNWIYTAISPSLVILGYLLRKRRWFVVGVHHLIGWSMYCTAKKRQ